MKHYFLGLPNISSCNSPFTDQLFTSASGDWSLMWSLMWSLTWSLTWSMIQVLLDVGASVNYRDLKGMTPLYNAICDGNSDLTTEILLKEKCDLDMYAVFVTC